jgi:glycosyltransferase involved in cell wall biosynthesis
MPSSSRPDAARPRVSVVIPARDEEAFVSAAIDSAAGQTMPPDQIEVIVVANACRDRTADVVRAYAADHPSIALQLLEEAQPGVARAKDLGARTARGQLLLFLDADSRMSTDLADRVAARADQGEHAGSIRIVADSADRLDLAFFRLIEWGKGIFGIHANMLWCDRELFLAQGGFDVTLNHAEDLEFLRRLSLDGIHLGHISESWIATSPRRLRRLPFRLGMATTLGRWALGHMGLGRRWPY